LGRHRSDVVCALLFYLYFAARRSGIVGLAGRTLILFRRRPHIFGAPATVSVAELVRGSLGGTVPLIVGTWWCTHTHTRQFPILSGRQSARAGLSNKSACRCAKSCRAVPHFEDLADVASRSRPSNFERDLFRLSGGVSLASSCLRSVGDSAGTQTHLTQVARPNVKGMWET
jgi:hypothetical protein